MTWRTELRDRADTQDVTISQVDLLELLDMADHLDTLLVVAIEVLDPNDYKTLLDAAGAAVGEPRVRHLLDLLSSARRIEPA